MDKHRRWGQMQVSLRRRLCVISKHRQSWANTGKHRQSWANTGSHGQTQAVMGKRRRLCVGGDGKTQAVMGGCPTKKKGTGCNEGTSWREICTTLILRQVQMKFIAGNQT